jgi:hypothetical protein
MTPMKPMPHVHTYVQNGAGERISKRCIHADMHPPVIKSALRRWLTKVLHAIFGGQQ